MNSPPPSHVLDTHVWLWLARGDPELSASTVAALRASAAQAPLLIPAISVWEIAMLEHKGRLRLGRPTAEWVREALARPDLAIAPLTPEVAVESCNLPGRLHADPADRMIVATARLRGATLVSRDRRLLAYGTEGHVNVLAA